MGRPLEEILAELAQVTANNNQKIMAAGLGAPKQFSDDIVPAENYYTSGAPSHKITYDYDPAVDALKATVQKFESSRFEEPENEPSVSRPFEEPAEKPMTIREYFNREPSEWDSLESRPDYEENSQFRSTYRGEPVKPLFTQFEGNLDNGYDDIEHDIINGDKNAKLTWLADNGWNNVETSRMATLESLNDKQKKNYNYLYNTEGKDSAKAYLDDIQKDLNAQRMATDKAYWQEEGKKNPGVVSMAASGILGLNSAVENLAIPSNIGNLKGNPSVFQATNASRAIQQGAQENATGFDKALWNIGSIANRILAQAAGKKVARYFMAAQTFNSTLYDELEKGVDELPALGISASAAAAELAVSNYIGKQIGLTGADGKAVIDLFASETGIPKVIAAFVPGYIGYAGSKISNIVAETLLASDKSHASDLYTRHLNNGENAWAAAGNTMKDLIDEVTTQGVFGGIATGIMTGLKDLGEMLMKPKTGLSTTDPLNEYEKPLEIEQNPDINSHDITGENLPATYTPQNAPVAPETNIPVVPDNLPIEATESLPEANTSDIEPNDIVPDPVYNMDEGKRQIFDAVKGLEELGNNGSRTMITFYNGENPGAYMSEMMRYYIAGVGGQDLDEVPESELLNRAQIEAIYDAGRLDWESQLEEGPEEPIEAPVEEPIEASSAKVPEGNYQVGDKIFTTEDEAVNYVLGGKAEPGSKIVRTNEPANSSYDRKGGLKPVDERPFAEPAQNITPKGYGVSGETTDLPSVSETSIKQSTRDSAAKRLSKDSRGHFDDNGNDFLAHNHYFVRSKQGLSSLPLDEQEPGFQGFKRVEKEFTSDGKSDFGIISFNNYKAALKNAEKEIEPNKFVDRGGFTFIKRGKFPLAVKAGDNFVNAKYLRDILSVIGGDGHIYRSTDKPFSLLYITGPDGDAILLPYNDLVDNREEDENYEDKRVVNEGSSSEPTLSGDKTTERLDNGKTSDGRGNVSKEDSVSDSEIGEREVLESDGRDGMGEGDSGLHSGGDNKRRDIRKYDIDGVEKLSEDAQVSFISNETGKDFMLEIGSNEWKSNDGKITLEYNEKENDWKILGVEDGGWHRSLTDVLHLINGTQEPSAFDDISEEEMIRQVSEGTGLEFTYNDHLERYEANIGTKSKPIIISVRYSNYYPGVHGGSRFVSASVNGKTSSSSLPSDSVESLIKGINKAIEEYAPKKKVKAKAPEEKNAETDANQKADVAIDTSSPKNFDLSNYDKESIPKTPKERIAANVEAIRTVKNVMAENRNATLEEQDILAKYTGWGGVGYEFNYVDELKELLTDEEYKTARSSIRDAFYTPIEVIQGMYNGLISLGYKGGRMLEPSMGSGRFVGMLPDSLKQKTQTIVGVEMDGITGNISQYLYPEANVHISKFENVTVPKNYFDLVIGNVPFGSERVFDPEYDKSISKQIHNYFIAKSIDSVRPGGLVCVISSAGTLDSNNYNTKKYIMDRADFVGAIRLPNSTHTGSQVVSDILVFQKRPEGVEYKGLPFMESKEVEYRRATVSINEYFIDHPDMVLGEIGATWRGTVDVIPPEDFDIEKSITDAFKNMKLHDYSHKETVEGTVKIRKDNERKRPNIKKSGEKIVVPTGDSSVEISKKEKNFDILSRYIDIRDTAKDLIQLQADAAPQKDVEKKRAELNKLYDDFAKKYSSLYKNRKVFEIDCDSSFVNVLEKVKKEGRKTEVLKADIFFKNIIKPIVEPDHCDTLEEGLMASMLYKGIVDTAFISKICSKKQEEVEDELTKSKRIFRTGDTTFEYSDVYLCGNVRQKLKNAESLAALDKRYSLNVEALKEVCPKEIPAEEIGLNFGVEWIPTEVYEQYVAEKMGYEKNEDWRGNKIFSIELSPVDGSYTVEVSNEFSRKRDAVNISEWGTEYKPFIGYEKSMVNTMLNSKDMKVTVKANDEVDRAASARETELARQKKQEIENDFFEWLWSDSKRKKVLQETYNDIFNAFVEPKFDGSMLEFPGLAEGIELYQHQKNIVARILFNPYNTLDAHCVGAGKTLSLICAAVIRNRMGISNKALFVVPLNKVSDWANDFRKFFPTSKVYVVDTSGLSPKKKKDEINRIMTTDCNFVIMHYQNLEKIPMSPNAEKEYVEEELRKLRSALENSVNNKTVSQIETAIADYEAKLNAINAEIKHDLDDFYFDDLGFDSLYVDEAQYYKNKKYYTHMSGVIDMGSQNTVLKTEDFASKVFYMNRLTNYRGVVFATATPILNALPEAYTMMSYLMPQVSEALGIQYFDSFCKTFANPITVTRLKTSGTGFEEKTSLTEYRNLPEFRSIWGLVADTISSPEELPYLKIPKIKGGKPQVIESERSEFQDKYMKYLAERARRVEGRPPREGEDNILVVMHDARTMSYTQRFIDERLPFEEDGKIHQLIDNVKRIYDETEEQKGTQLVFCDLGVPGSNSKKITLNLYEAIKNMLIVEGIPAEEIEFIQDHKKNLEPLFEKVNKGEVRVLLGSAKTMGEGVNVQERAKALHAINPFGRPGDWEQAQGRIVRQGNMFDEVEVLVYVTKNTYDGHDWDALKRKAKMVGRLSSGELEGRVAKDDGGTAETAAMITAIADNNPVVLELFETKQKIDRLENLKIGHNKEIKRSNDKIKELRISVVEQTEYLENFIKDLEKVKDISGDNFAIEINGKQFNAKTRQNAEELFLKTCIAIQDKKGESKYKTVGHFAGFEICVSPWGSMGLKGENLYRGKGDKESGNINLASASGTMTRLCNIALSINEKTKEALEKRLAATKADLAKYEELVKGGFAQEKELQDARIRVEELNDELLAMGANSDDDFDFNTFEASLPQNTFVEDIDDYEEDTPSTQAYIGESSTNWTTSRVGSKDKKPMAIDDLVAKIKHDWNIQITPGHMGRRPGKVRGFFDTHNKGVRTREDLDIPTIAHELGHGLDERYGFTSGRIPKEIKEEFVKALGALASEYSEKNHKTEGLAELIRKYLTNSEEAFRDYPKAMDWIFSKLNEKERDALEELADEINAFFTLTTPEDHVRSGLEKRRNFETVYEHLQKMKAWFKVNWLDSDDPIKKLSPRAYVLAANSRYADEIVDKILMHELRDKEGNYVGAGLRYILNDLELLPDEYKQLNSYLVLKVALERVAAGIEIYGNPVQDNVSYISKEIAKVESEHPEWIDFADKLFDWVRQFTWNWAVKYNLVSEDVATLWDETWKNYLPLYRSMDHSGGTATIGNNYANRKAPFHRLKGGKQMVLYPIENIMDMVRAVVHEAMKNDVFLEVCNEAEKSNSVIDATIMEKVPVPMESHTFDISGIKEQLAAGAEGALAEGLINQTALKTFDDLLSGLDDLLVQYEQKRGGTKQNIVTVMRNGQPEFWKINDPILLASITCLTKPHISPVLAFIGGSTRFLSAMATGTNLLWAVFRNGPKDIQTAAAYLDSVKFIDFFKNMGFAYMNTIKYELEKGKVHPLHSEYLSMGGGGGSQIDEAVDWYKQAKINLTGSKLRKFLAGINPINFVVFITDLIENGPREAVYIMCRNAGMSPEDSMYCAHEITVNFYRKGIQSSQVNMISMFFNAAIQGMYKLVRFYSADDIKYGIPSGGAGGGGKPPVGGDGSSKGFGDDPKSIRNRRAKTAVKRFSVLIAASVILAYLNYVLNHKDEESEKEYKMQSNYNKNTNFLIPLGNGKYFAISKPREIAIFESLFERWFESVGGDNNRAFSEFYDYVVDNCFPSLIADFSKVFAPDDRNIQERLDDMTASMLGDLALIGIFSNMNSNRDFLGRPIVSAAEETLEPKDQYDGATSKIAYWIGHGLNMSPEKIDYFGEQVLSYIWKIQKALFPMDESKIDTTLGVYNTYVKDSAYSNDIVNELYDYKNRSEKSSNSDPENMDKLILKTMDNNMTTFWGRFSALNKQFDSEDPRGERMTVLGMIDEYLDGRTAEHTGGLGIIEDVVRESGDNTLLPSVMKTKIKNSKDEEFELRDSEYYEYQTLYNGLYYSKVETAISDDMSNEKKAAIIKQARTEAQTDATNIMLKRHFNGSVKGATSDTTNEADYVSPTSTISTAEEKEIKAENKAATQEAKNNLESNPTRVEVANSNLWSRATQEQKDYLDKILVKIAAGKDSTSENYRNQISRARQYGYSETDWAKFQLARQIVDKPTKKGQYHTYTNAENKEAAELAGLSYEKIKKIISNK